MRTWGANAAVQVADCDVCVALGERTYPDIFIGLFEGPWTKRVRRTSAPTSLPGAGRERGYDQAGDRAFLAAERSAEIYLSHGRNADPSAVANRCSGRTARQHVHSPLFVTGTANGSFPPKPSAGVRGSERPRCAECSRDRVAERGGRNLRTAQEGGVSEQACRLCIHMGGPAGPIV